jgi:hypothetical protein
MDQLEKFLDDLFLKKITYQLPAKAKEVIVQIAPWVTLIVLIISLPAILAVFGLGTFIAGMGYYGVALGPWYYISIAVLAVQAVIMGLSIPGLMQKSKRGWRLVYYSSLISAAHSLLFSGNLGGAIWSLLGSAIGLYIIFQVKSYYN